MRRIPIPSAAIACAAATALAGCVSQPTMTGVRIGEETLRQFEAGVTTEAWLIAMLGPPTSRSAVEGIPNTEVFRYSFVEANDATRTGSVVYFILTDGLVTRFWADRRDDPGLLGGSGEKPAVGKIGSTIIR